MVTEPPGPNAWRKNKGKNRYGPGRVESRRRQVLSRQETASQGGDYGVSTQGESGGELESRKASMTSGSSFGMGCPMVGCGMWVTDLRGHCVKAHIPEVFRDL